MFNSDLLMVTNLEPKVMDHQAMLLQEHIAHYENSNVDYLFAHYFLSYFHVWLLYYSYFNLASASALWPCGHNLIIIQQTAADYLHFFPQRVIMYAHHGFRQHSFLR